MSHNKILPITRVLGSKLISSPRHSSSTSAPQNCVIFLHGSGASGSDIANVADPLLSTLPNTIVLYPTAPLRPYSLNDGELTRVWHDRTGLDPLVPEDESGINDMGQKLAGLISEVNGKFNIPNSRIVVGGFSQGGHMALQIGYRDILKEPVAGVFALSTFLAEGSAVYEAVRNKKKEGTELPPLFMAHGTSDWMVSLSWSKRSFELLSELGLNAKFYEFDGAHDVAGDELNELCSWLCQRLPSS